jgi:hypothetical protein
MMQELFIKWLIVNWSGDTKNWIIKGFGTAKLR